MKHLQGGELFSAQEQLQGMPASYVLRVCGHVTPTCKDHRRSRLAPLFGLWCTDVILSLASCIGPLPQWFAGLVTRIRLRSRIPYELK
jgi:hypothetical protein